MDTYLLSQFMSHAASRFSRELTADEVRLVIDTDRLPEVLHHLWGFTGHFYRWPQTLLLRDDLPGSILSSLKDNLHDELGGEAGLPHTDLFASMAASLDVILPSAGSPGTFMEEILTDASTLPPEQAIGQLFANEATPKWQGFVEVLKDWPNADMTFFDIHSGESEHYQDLLTGFTIEQSPALLRSTINFAIMRACFMDQVRQIFQQQSGQQMREA